MLIVGNPSLLSKLPKFPCSWSGRRCCPREKQLVQSPCSYIVTLTHGWFTTGFWFCRRRENQGCFSEATVFCQKHLDSSFIMFIWNVCSELMHLSDNFIDISSWIIIFCVSIWFFRGFCLLKSYIFSDQWFTKGFIMVSDLV